jgi:membrane associated rhomboid family serine protease
MRRGTIPFALPPFQGWVRRLVLACAAVFLMQQLLQAYAPKLKDLLEIYASLVPAGVIGHGFLWQLVTYSFLHHGWMHLLGNMLTLWMVGSLEEMEWGKQRFLELYFFSVVGAALTTIVVAYLHLFRTAPTDVVMGASGGTMGLLMALAVLDGDREFMMLLFFVVPIRLKVKYLVAIIAFGVFVATIQAAENVANAAHVGGLLSGFLWAKFVPRRGLAFEASEAFYGAHNAWHRWKRRQAAKKFEVYMRKSEREVPRFDDKGNYIPPDDNGPRKPNGDSGSGSKWVN